MEQSPYKQKVRTRLKSPLLHHSSFQQENMDEEMDERRTLQMENSRLSAENKQLKDKHNRVITENRDLQTNLDTMKQEWSTQRSEETTRLVELSRTLQLDVQGDNVALVKQNGDLKQQIVSLRQEMKSGELTNENCDRLAKLVEVYKEEVAVSKASIEQLTELVEASQSHTQDLESRLNQSLNQINQLTQVKDLLTQQLDTCASGSIMDRQLKSIQKRLQVTEERLYQERADRANNLSDIEEKLITENARLQAAEKELSRQLQRQKICAESQDSRIRELREDNERLRLSMPLEMLTSKTYELPQSIHSTMRNENMKDTEIDPDYVMSQIGRLEGLGHGQESQIITSLWVKLDSSLRQLQELDLHFVELRDDPDATLIETVKSVRDMKREFEEKLTETTTRLTDIQSEKETLDAVYKQSLGTLVEERQDAFARLKNMEDIIDAIHTENEILRQTGGEVREVVCEGSVTSHEHQGALNENEDLQNRLSSTNQQVQSLEVQLSQLSSELRTREEEVVSVRREMEGFRGGERVGGVARENALAVQVETLTSELEKTKTMYESMIQHKTSLDQRIVLLQSELTDVQKRVAVIDQLQATKEELTTRLDTTETSLNQSTSQHQCLQNDMAHQQHKLRTEQEHRTQLEAQLSTLTTDLTSRDHSLTALREAEGQRVKHVEMMGVTVNSLNAQLDKAKCTVKRLEVELSLCQDRLTECGRGESGQSASAVSSETSIHMTLREVERERASIKTQLLDTCTELETLKETLHEKMAQATELSHTSQQDKERATLLSMENRELQHEIKICTEEKENILEEKSSLESEVMELEERVAEVVRKCDGVTDESDGSDMTTDQAVKEIGNLRTITEGKDMEIQGLKNKLRHNKHEMAMLCQRIEYLNTSQQTSRNDATRALGDLNSCMKEKASMVQLNEFLDKEKTRYQSEGEKQQKLVDTEKESVVRKSTDISDILGKLEKCEGLNSTLESDHDRLNDELSQSKATIQDAERTISQLTSENDQLKASINQIDQDVHSLTAINSTLDSQLQAERAALSTEKQTSNKQKDDLNTSSNHLQGLKHEQTLWLAMIDNERKTSDKLKETIQDKEEEIVKLKDNVEELKGDLESVKSELGLCQQTVERLRDDKQTMLQDLEEASRKVIEAESGTSRVSEDHRRRMVEMEKGVSLDKANMEKDRVFVEKECAIARQKIDDLNEKLRQKELQLSGFGKTLQELESVTQSKREVESKLTKAEQENQDSKIIVTSHRAEISALRDQIDHIKGGHDKMQDSNEDLKEKMLIERARAAQELREVQSRLSAINVQHGHETGGLSQQICVLEAKLQTSQEAVKSLRSSCDDLTTKCRSLEQGLSQAKIRIQEEAMNRQLAQETVTVMKERTDDRQRLKTGLETRVQELQTSLSKCEHKLQSERSKTVQLHSANQEYEQKIKSVTTSHQEKITVLQKELKQQTSVHGAKYSSTVNEYKSQLEASRTEVQQLQTHIKHLLANLDTVKADNTQKNKDNLRLQEDMLLIEDKLRDMASKLKLVQDSLKVEQDMQARLHVRNQEAEGEVRQMKTVLNKFGGGQGDNKWDGLSERVGELTTQLKSHLETRREPDTTETVRWYTQKLKDTEVELEGEKVMHEVTKKSLRDAEDDLANLRQNLRAHKHRSPAIEDRSDKSRTERINEIIARSQIQAQAMLASGAQFTDVVTASLNSQLSPMSHMSPLNMSHVSQRNTSPLSHMSQLNTSHQAITSLNCSFNSTSTDNLATTVGNRDSFDST